MELIAFQAFPAGRVVDLEWTTASERNSERFEVERSLDGTLFTRIGALAAAGSSQQARHYVFTDVSPHFGINYYRLRQVDTDGGHTFSLVRSVSIAHTGTDVRLVPNPGSGLVDVLFGPKDAGSQFVMLDATGREVLRAGLGDVRTTIDVSRLPSGLYAYRVLSASGGSTANGTWLRE
ncbi:MAG: T9SS type A sorting domain-containing protein [Flavobacteriales bacterium]|nr:T9SS type A sorting domain-containing protein [Flavobacteriales bacterium]